MDFLFIFISIAGIVFAAVMLLLGFRTMRMERESDARVDELQTLATGSVLFVPGGPTELLADSDDITEAPLPLPLIDVVAPMHLESHDDGLELAWDEMIDETAGKVHETVEKTETRDWTPDVQTPGHQFVLTVPATAGAAPAFSFSRIQRRSRT
jgi:hypothetical protein